MDQVAVFAEVCVDVICIKLDERVYPGLIATAVEYVRKDLGDSCSFDRDYPGILFKEYRERLLAEDFADREKCYTRTIFVKAFGVVSEVRPKTALGSQAVYVDDVADLAGKIKKRGHAWSPLDCLQRE